MVIVIAVVVLDSVPTRAKSFAAVSGVGMSLSGRRRQCDGVPVGGTALVLEGRAAKLKKLS